MHQPPIPSLKFVGDTLSVSVLISRVTVTFDLLTLNLIHFITRRVGNLPANYGISGTFCYWLIEKSVVGPSLNYYHTVTTQWYPVVVSLRRVAISPQNKRTPTIKPGSIQTQSLALRALRALRKWKPQETQALAFSRNKRKRQPIGMLGRSSDNHDWLLANASACVSCGFHLRNARNANDCVWMETGLQPSHGALVLRMAIFTVRFTPCFLRIKYYRHLAYTYKSNSAPQRDIPLSLTLRWSDWKTFMWPFGLTGWSSCCWYDFLLRFYRCWWCCTHVGPTKLTAFHVRWHCADDGMHHVMKKFIRHSE